MTLEEEIRCNTTPPPTTATNSPTHHPTTPPPHQQVTYSTLEEIRCNTTAFENATDSAVAVDHSAESGDDSWMSLLALGGSTGVDKVLAVDAQKVAPLRHGATLWHDRDYVLTSTVPEVMAGGYYVQQQVKTIEEGTVIAISTTTSATIFVAFETLGSPDPPTTSRDGGFNSSLPQAGWTKVPTTALKYDCSGTCGYMDTVYSWDAASASTVYLPPTTTDETLMMIVVVTRGGWTTVADSSAHEGSLSIKENYTFYKACDPQ